MTKRLAVLTGGGHIAGFGAALASIQLEATERGYHLFGSLNGWDGLLGKGNLIHLQNHPGMNELIHQAGTLIGSSRTNPFSEKIQDGPQQVVDNLKNYGIDAVIALGGEDTLSVAAKLSSEPFKSHAVGWPKTMDNDLPGTDFCIGYPTAVSQGGQVVRDSYATALSHGRVTITTLFGRHTDWVVAGAGYYGHADVVVPAETPTPFDRIYARIIEATERNKERYNQPFAVVAVAEGAEIDKIKWDLESLQNLVGAGQKDMFDHKKINPELLGIFLGKAVSQRAKESGKKLDCAIITESYQLRNGQPVEVDIKYGWELGKRCVDLVDRGAWGYMATVRRNVGLHVSEAPIPLKDGKIQRRMASTYDHVDTNLLQVNERSFSEYICPILGSRGPHPLDRVVYRTPFEIARCK